MKKNYLDKKKRILFSNNEIQRVVLKHLYSNINIHPAIKTEAQKRITGLNLNSSKTRIRNRCVITGRGKGISFKMSRHNFRILAQKGLITGVRLSSW